MSVVIKITGRTDGEPCGIAGHYVATIDSLSFTTDVRSAYLADSFVAAQQVWRAYLTGYEAEVAPLGGILRRGPHVVVIPEPEPRLPL